MPVEKQCRGECQSETVEGRSAHTPSERRQEYPAGSTPKELVLRADQQCDVPREAAKRRLQEDRSDLTQKSPRSSVACWFPGQIPLVPTDSNMAHTMNSILPSCEQLPPDTHSSSRAIGNSQSGFIVASPPPIISVHLREPRNLSRQPEVPSNDILSPSSSNTTCIQNLRRNQFQQKFSRSYPDIPSESVNYQPVLDRRKVAGGREKEEEKRERNEETLSYGGRETGGMEVAGLLVGKDGDSRVRDNVFNYLQDVT
ncbi:hypothetical protein WN55_08381 [Dufourea novaeangliae]|uniref:Uncharacterized protein n=1 Tax=Dufourea novaeangliae TaxID=178035 RepID=A0A154P6Q8_DUFNO|nr:hypothetical protein WN55_08381 [Dufourea novaeangliae]